MEKSHVSSHLSGSGNVPVTFLRRRHRSSSIPTILQTPSNPWPPPCSRRRTSPHPKPGGLQTPSPRGDSRAPPHPSASPPGASPLIFSAPASFRTWELAHSNNDRQRLFCLRDGGKARSISPSKPLFP